MDKKYLPTKEEWAKMFTVARDKEALEEANFANSINRQYISSLNEIEQLKIQVGYLKSWAKSNGLPEQLKEYKDWEKGKLSVTEDTHNLPRLTVAEYSSIKWTYTYG